SKPRGLRRQPKQQRHEAPAQTALPRGRGRRLRIRRVPAASARRCGEGLLRSLLSLVLILRRAEARQGRAPHPLRRRRLPPPPPRPLRPQLPGHRRRRLRALLLEAFQPFSPVSPSSFGYHGGRDGKFAPWQRQIGEPAEQNASCCALTDLPLRGCCT
uniref:Uncharacterized protein n=1 Tax=Aegilops tauschii subsp. strangulata TaxID=200361 RepID=A0A453SYH4_AEGTS